MPGPLLGIPLWAWLTGAGVAGAAVVADQAGDAMDSAADMADASAKPLEHVATITKWAVVAGGLYVSYRALKSTGALK